MNEKQSSIKLKLLYIGLITSGVVLVLTCSAFFAHYYYSYRKITRIQITTLGEIIANNSTAALAFQSADDANEILKALKAESHIVAAALYDKHGQLFTHYPQKLPASSLPGKPGTTGYYYRNNSLEGFEPVVQQGRQVGTLYLKSDLKGINSGFILYAWITMLVTIIAISITYLLSRRLHKTVSDPILALANTAGVVSSLQDYTIRAKKFDDDEVGQLTDAFNQMLEQIERQNVEITSFNQALEKKVTERTNQLEHTNSELILKNEFVEAIIDSSIDIIAVFDRNLRYLILNKYGQDVYGVKQENFLGKNILEVFPALEDSKMYNDLTEALKGKLIHNPYYISSISSKILENFYIPLLDKNGLVYCVLVIGHDITDKILATEQLRALNNELAKSNRDLEQFAYIASHDLQEPLRKIQTYSTLLEKEMNDRNALVTYIPKIIASVVRMKDLINSILNYSQTSNLTDKFEDVNLNEVIDNIKIDYELSIKEKNAVIIADALPVIEGDKLQLNQLFLNLISNSLKFSNRKPEILISSAVIEKIDPEFATVLNQNGRYVKLTFTDNGIGFDQQFADKVFAIFQRLHSRSEYPGTGIGLALCKKIVDNHKGYISVNSKKGQGTTFKIYFPLAG